MADFQAVYYGARCMVYHADPYQESELTHIYRDADGEVTTGRATALRVITSYVNLPTSLIVTAPFGALEWRPAHLLWMGITAAAFILASWLMWNEAANYAPVISGLLIFIFLANSELLLEIGNAAGIAVALCTIGVWCILKGRRIWVGILALALSLALKPHLGGLVLLYLLLASGRQQKRALQTFVVYMALAVPMLIWTFQVAPHWMSELRTNLAQTSQLGDINDPISVNPAFHGASIIDLQSVFSLIRNSPRFYNQASYLTCAPLLLVWAITTVRKKFSLEGAWLGLAAIAPLSMLPLYHRTHDTRLLLLVLPAFAFIWARGGISKWLALLFTGAAVSVIGIFPAQLIAIYTEHLRGSIQGLPGLLLALAFTRTAPLILLGMSIFYVWSYVHYSPELLPAGELENHRLTSR